MLEGGLETPGVQQGSGPRKARHGGLGILGTSWEISRQGRRDEVPSSQLAPEQETVWLPTTSGVERGINAPDIDMGPVL